ncbi:hypothetical protein KC660_00655 [Candidatus Dojkabacteria bacterium]|uniref:Uncharacterized protein n=1 Tax=Candidatus Dojkabacteria bacterium TaxID=2099670 RepID=A0A955L380_9BACT|nr:hypothetical protein [Candidatus Dojkabacteria bacterium]
MEIYKYGTNSIFVKDGSSSFVILNEDGLAKKITGLEPTMVINCVKDKFADVTVIDSPGEYEIGGVYVETLMFEEKSKLMLIEYEDVVMVYLDCNPNELSQAILDKVASANIVFAVMSADSKEMLNSVVDLVNEVEPEIFIPIGDESLQSTLPASFGNKEIQPEKKLKIKSSEVGNDDSVTSLYLLKSS